MKPKLERSILVTGASKGIGRAIACRVAKDGFPVVVHYGRDRDGAEETADRILQAGGSARVLGFDIADHDASVNALTEDMEDRKSVV